MDLIKSIYHERQEPGSMLCAQHALNNLVQNPLFTPQDLASIAQQLDRLEAAQLGGVGSGMGGRASENYDDSGFFSIMVMEDALRVLGLRLVRWQSQDMVPFHAHPEQMEAFVLNQELHWFTIRRFAVPERFYNLDSCKPLPEWISPTFLGLTLKAAEEQGYSVFVVLPTEDAQISGLPASHAAEVAATLPAPSSRFGNSSTHPLPNSVFLGSGQLLGGYSRSKRPASSAEEEMESEGSPSESVESESEKRRRRVRIADEDDDVVSGVARAIEESLRTSSLEDHGRKRKTSTEEAEERALEDAIKASLEATGAVPAMHGGDDDDNPSLEELRRRRLARFGG